MQHIRTPLASTHSSSQCQGDTGTNSNTPDPYHVSSRQLAGASLEQRTPGPLAHTYFSSMHSVRVPSVQNALRTFSLCLYWFHPPCQDSPFVEGPGTPGQLPHQGIPCTKHPRTPQPMQVSALIAPPGHPPALRTLNISTCTHFSFSCPPRVPSVGRAPGPH